MSHEADLIKVKRKGSALIINEGFKSQFNDVVEASKRLFKIREANTIAKRITNEVEQTEFEMDIQSKRQNVKL